MKKILVLVPLLAGLSCKAQGPFQISKILYDPDGCDGTPTVAIFLTGGTPPYSIGDEFPQDSPVFSPPLEGGDNNFEFIDASEQSITTNIFGNNSVLGEIEVEIGLNCDGTGVIKYDVLAPPDGVTIDATLEGPDENILFGSTSVFSFENLDAGTYDLIIAPKSDDPDNPLDCPSDIRMFIVIPEFKPFTITSITSTSLSSPQGGTIRVEIDGGFPPYTYLLNLEGVIVDEERDTDAKMVVFNNIEKAAMYRVGVRDSSDTLLGEFGCPQGQDITVNPFENPISNRVFFGYCSTGT